MNAVKDSMLIRDHDPEVEEITILFTDLRAFGKGFDEFRCALQGAGQRRLRAGPSGEGGSPARW